MQSNQKIINYKLMGEIQKSMEKPSEYPDLAYKLLTNLTTIMPWIIEDINNRDIIIAFLLEKEINFFNSRELDISLKLLKHICRFDHINYLKKSLSFFIEIYPKQQNQQPAIIQSLFEFCVENHYLRLVIEYFLFEKVTISNFELAKKIATIVAGIGSQEALASFLSKTTFFSENEKKLLIKDYLLPYAISLSTLLKERCSVATYHPTLLTVYKAADQNYHQATIHYQAASIAIRLRQGSFIFDNSEINRIGQWRRRLAIINKTPPVADFATKRTEIDGHATIAKNVYAGLPNLMMKISADDKSYLVSDDDLSERKGVVRMVVYYPEANQKGIPLSRLHLDYDEPSSSLVEHCPPSSFNQLIAYIDKNINEIKGINIDEALEQTSIVAVIKLIAKFQWLFAQGTFMKRGDGTNNEVITLGLFLYHKLSVGNFKEIPYYHAYATPNVKNFQDNYFRFFNILPCKLKENKPNYDNWLKVYK